MIAVANSLRRSGFTNVKVMPDSFLVRATDKSGNPVTMFIGPNSTTEVTVRQLVGISVGIGSNWQQKLFQIQLVMVLGDCRPGAPARLVEKKQVFLTGVRLEASNADRGTRLFAK